MKTPLRIAAIALVLAVAVHSQSQETRVLESSPSGMTLALRFDEEPFEMSDGSPSEIEYLAARGDEPGSPRLPSRIVYVAVPPGAEARCELRTIDVRVRRDVAPVANEAPANDGAFRSIERATIADEYLRADSYPTADVEVVRYIRLQNLYLAVVRVNTHRFYWKRAEIVETREAELRVTFEGGGVVGSAPPLSHYEKALSGVVANYEQAVAFRSRLTEPIDDKYGRWLDYSKPHAKLAITDDGVHRITRADLAAYGFDVASIDPRNLAIYNRGKLVPIFVEGEADGSFDANDFVEFYAQKNYADGDHHDIVPVRYDYVNYMNRYTDTTYVWLRVEDDTVARVEVANAGGAASDTLDEHVAFLHLEESPLYYYYDAEDVRTQKPYWQENKVRTWKAVDFNDAETFSFEARNVVADSAARFVARLISVAYDFWESNIVQHSTGLSVNGSTLDSIRYDEETTVNFEVSFSGGLLSEGENQLTIFGRDTGTDPNQILIDWIEVEYVARNVALEDSLVVRVPKGVARGVRAVSVSNLPASAGEIAIYKTAPTVKKIVGFSRAGDRIVFVDEFGGGDEYVVAAESKFRTPIFKTRKTFVNLRNPARDADYIAISNRKLEASATRYADFIDANYPYRVETAWIDDVYDEFSFGYPEAEAVRRFLQSATTNWSGAAPSFVALIGDANYDYKNETPMEGERKENLVPSFGNPCSDVWFATWEGSAPYVPQLFIGRIPGGSDEEIDRYRERHASYLTKPFDLWNKTFLFFSGGARAPEANQFRSYHDISVRQTIGEPMIGETTHFYKTFSPISNHAPYSREEADAKIDEGAVFISYVGHSGTRTWDNGIEEVEDLKNAYDDRHPLIYDFGCSTGKFAEPNVDAFANLFVTGDPDGQAIAYIGNSSWGYTSQLPVVEMFFDRLVVDTTTNIVAAHTSAKLELMDRVSSESAQVYALCNLYFGDPAIDLAVPRKPNFVARVEDARVTPDAPTDSEDSTTARFVLNNFGLASPDSLRAVATALRAGDTTAAASYRRSGRTTRDTLEIAIPVRNRAGESRVEFRFDATDEIDEIYESDNSAEFRFTVFSSSVRSLQSDDRYATTTDAVRLLAPSDAEEGANVRMQLSVNPAFDAPVETVVEFDSLVTAATLPELSIGERYYWRAKLDAPNAEWNAGGSFLYAELDYEWYIDEPAAPEDVEAEGIAYDANAGGWTLANEERPLTIKSAGAEAGQTISFLYDGSERLSNTYFSGIAASRLDERTLEPTDETYFKINDDDPGQALVDYIDALPEGALVAAAICDDGVASVLGGSVISAPRQALADIGSQFADDIGYRDSWCIVGVKGAAPGTVPEVWRGRYEAMAIIDTSVVARADSGFVVFPEIGPVGDWDSLTVDYDSPANASLELMIAVRGADGSADTLSPATAPTQSLAALDAGGYDRASLIARMTAEPDGDAPVARFLGVGFTPPAELTTNVRLVSFESEVVEEGTAALATIAVGNAGELTARNFEVKVERVKPNNERELLAVRRVDSLAAGALYAFETSTPTTNALGENRLVVTIDSANAIAERYEDNNVFEKRFVVERDTAAPFVRIFFDDVEALEGDYVSPTPRARVELADSANLQIVDTSALTIYLDDRRLSYRAGELAPDYNAENPKMIVSFEPTLEDGEHTLTIYGEDASGNPADSTGRTLTFVVESETKLLNVYNYPNPTAGETWFTFELTRAPEAASVYVYTVAGRMIRKLELSPAELRVGFNRVYWDGRDAEGDPLANGVYLYKVTTRRNGETKSVIEKLAIVR